MTMPEERPQPDPIPPPPDYNAMIDPRYRRTKEEREAEKARPWQEVTREEMERLLEEEARHFAWQQRIAESN